MNDGQDEYEKSNKKIFEDMKKDDKGFYTWGFKNSKVETYSSGELGSQIRDAVTGDRYRDYKVGSKYEDLFFKVKMVSKNFDGKDAPTFFYSSPEQYEKHSREIIASEIKDKWITKKMAADASLRREMERNEERTRNFTIVT